MLLSIDHRYDESLRINICILTFELSFLVSDQTIFRIQTHVNFRKTQYKIKTAHLDVITEFMVSWFDDTLRYISVNIFYNQEAVKKAEELLNLHQGYQRNLKAFETWLEEEQEKLSCLSHLEGDAQRQEATLRDLQVQCV